jgi:hypothetical protein
MHRRPSINDSWHGLGFSLLHALILRQMSFLQTFRTNTCRKNDGYSRPHTLHRSLFVQSVSNRPTAISVMRGLLFLDASTVCSVFISTSCNPPLGQSTAVFLALSCKTNCYHEQCKPAGSIHPKDSKTCASGRIDGDCDNGWMAKSAETINWFPNGPCPHRRRMDQSKHENTHNGSPAAVAHRQPTDQLGLVNNIFHV